MQEENKVPARGTALLLFHKYKILRLLETEDYQALQTWLKGWQDSAARRVRRGSDSVEIYRAQGELDVLDRILGLKEELLAAEKRKLANEVAENERQRVPIGG